MNRSISVQVRAVLANGKFWSGILCAASFSRGTAYIQRPPVANSFAGKAIETFIEYPTWGWLLLMTTFAILVGHLVPAVRWMGIFGHAFSIIIYGTFAVSTIGASFFSNQSWATSGGLVVGCLLHFSCAIYFADEVACHRQGVES
jgi:hypothetical protein